MPKSRKVPSVETLPSELLSHITTYFVYDLSSSQSVASLEQTSKFFFALVNTPATASVTAANYNENNNDLQQQHANLWLRLLFLNCCYDKGVGTCGGEQLYAIIAQPYKQYVESSTSTTPVQVLAKPLWLFRRCVRYILRSYRNVSMEQVYHYAMNRYANNVNSKPATKDYFVLVRFRIF